MPLLWGGPLVATLHDGVLPSGLHTLGWSGVNDAGQDVKSGVYFARLEAGDQVATGKVLVVR